jgi:hypothetical protein
MQLLGLHVVMLLKCFLVVFGQQYHTHHDVADLHWKPATATWYGSPDGDGSNGKSLLYPLWVLSFVIFFRAIFLVVSEF